MTREDPGSRSWAARRRLEGLLLRRRKPKAPEAVVSELTAMQAQEHTYARWSVAQRCAPASTATDLAADVDTDFDDGRLLRTHVLRPTWHYVAPADLRWLTRLSGPRLVAAARRRFLDLGLDQRTLARAVDLITASVEGGPRTRPELSDVITRAGISVEGQRLSHILFYAEALAAVTSGPMRGRQHTHVPFDDRVASQAGPEGEEALSLLAWRYFSTRGPATLKDFAWWAGLSARDARTGLEGASSRLDRQEGEGRTYWLVDEGPAAATAPPRIDLIQCFDELIISYSESREVLYTEDIAFKTPLNIDGYRHVVVFEGRLLGHWRVVGPERRPVVETRLARQLDETEHIALGEAVDAYRRFATP